VGGHEATSHVHTQTRHLTRATYACRGPRLTVESSLCSTLNSSAVPPPAVEERRLDQHRAVRLAPVHHQRAPRSKRQRARDRWRPIAHRRSSGDYHGRLGSNGGDNEQPFGSAVDPDAARRQQRGTAEPANGHVLDRGLAGSDGCDPKKVPTHVRTPVRARRGSGRSATIVCGSSDCSMTEPR
jgi:hypothetical protein